MIINDAAPEVTTHHAIAGSFGKIRYFLATLDLRDAAENLQLLPQDNLSFKERIQRVLNEDRVRDEILPYLDNEERFFNSLVCILLPDENQTEGYWDFKPYRDSNKQPMSIGSFIIAKKVARVVLDGQHRFRALSMYWENKKNELALGAQKMDVPVAYVVIDSLGKMGQKGQDYRTKTTDAVRQLFAVLNKNAKLVDRTTLLLIDDSDITNVIARRVLEDGVIEEQLVKWHAGDSLNPIDPYFTTLHTVREMVRSFLVNKRTDWHAPEALTQRQQMLNKLYFEGIFPTFSLKEAIQLIFAKWRPYLEWKELLQQEGIQVSPQPFETSMKAGTKQRLTAARKNSLCFTVAGQRAILSGLAQTFLTGTSLSKATLEGLVEKLNVLAADGVFGRKSTKESPNVFRSVLFDQGGRMIFARPSVELAARIIAVSLGAKLERDSIEAEFNGMTNLDREELKKHWARCEKLFATPAQLPS